MRPPRVARVTNTRRTEAAAIDRYPRSPDGPPCGALVACLGVRARVRHARPSALKGVSEGTRSGSAMATAVSDAAPFEPCIPVGRRHLRAH